MNLRELDHLYKKNLNDYLECISLRGDESSHCKLRWYQLCVSEMDSSLVDILEDNIEEY